MGFTSAMLGNASEIDPKQAQTDYAQIPIPGEEIHRAYQIFRDAFLFTSRRLILVDRQGLTGSKVEYHSLPYKSITHFAVETAGGMFDLDAELKIWISGNKRFTKKVNVYDVQRVLAHYLLHTT